MARVSNTKVINDIEKYNRLYPKYIEVLDRLIAQYPTTNGSIYVSICPLINSCGYSCSNLFRS